MSCETAHYGKSLIFIFQEFFVSIYKILILRGRLSTRLSFHEILRISLYLWPIFPKFLRCQVLNFPTTRETTRIYHVYP